MATPKPGNVHRGADFEDLCFNDFVVSAVAIGPAIESAHRHGVGVAVLDAIRATRARAKILLFGQVAKGDEAAVDIGDVCLDEKHLIGSHSWSEEEADEADEVVFRREIELARLVTHRFPLEHAAEAFRKAADRADGVGKVVVTTERA